MNLWEDNMNNAVNQLELERKQYQKEIEFGEAIQQLYKNRHFRKVFEETFFVEECARYARMSGSSTIPEEARKDALAKAQSAGHIKEWLHSRELMAHRAKANLLSLDEEEIDYEVED